VRALAALFVVAHHLYIAVYPGRGARTECGGRSSYAVGRAGRSAIRRNSGVSIDGSAAA
jgi:hypothetical protein